MQYHFMLMYDDGTKSWSVDQDTFQSVMTDGTIYDKNVFPGWFWPKEGSPEEELDWSLYQTLQSIVSTIPIPQEA
jgi:hypothetical protein